MGLLTLGLNVTLDGCCDHRVGIADDELLDYFTELMDAAGAMLWGRITYELMESAWPAVARDENAARATREWARKLEAKPKYVVSSSRRDFPWNNTFRVEGDLHEAVRQLKEKTPQGVFVGSPVLSAALERLGLIDEYRLVLHPVLAGHGPTLFQGLEPSRHLELVSTKRLKSGALALHYRVRILQLFEHQHGEPREPQLAGHEQANRARPRDDHVVDQGVLVRRRSAME